MTSGQSIAPFLKCVDDGWCAALPELCRSDTLERVDLLALFPMRLVGCYIIGFKNAL